MPQISHPTATRKVGALYSWLMKNSQPFGANLRSIADAEKLYDAYAMAGIENVFDDYQPEFAIAVIGYDPAEAPQQLSPIPQRKSLRQPARQAVAA
jgi:hypothetical protein